MAGQAAGPARAAAPAGGEVAALVAKKSLSVRDTEALFRLPIDRVFSMKGFGAVVTGTLIAGRVLKDEEVEIFPARKRARPDSILAATFARSAYRTRLLHEHG